MAKAKNKPKKHESKIDGPWIIPQAPEKQRVQKELLGHCKKEAVRLIKDIKTFVARFPGLLTYVESNEQMITYHNQRVGTPGIVIVASWSVNLFTQGGPLVIWPTPTDCKPCIQREEHIAKVEALKPEDEIPEFAMNCLECKKGPWRLREAENIMKCLYDWLIGRGWDLYWSPGKGKALMVLPHRPGTLASTPEELAKTISDLIVIAGKLAAREDGGRPKQLEAEQGRIIESLFAIAGLQCDKDLLKRILEQMQ